MINRSSKTENRKHENEDIIKERKKYKGIFRMMAMGLQIKVPIHVQKNQFFKRYISKFFTEKFQKTKDKKKS